MAESDPGGCCRCCCSFIVTSGLTALFMWLSLRTSFPTCSIEQFYVPALNNSKNNHTIFFDLLLANRMKDKGVRYNNISLTFLYGGKGQNSINIANYTVKGFYQGHKKKARRAELVLTTGVPWPEAIAAVSNGSNVKFGVRLVTRVKFKIMFWYTKKQQLTVSGDVPVGGGGQKVSKKGKGIKLTSGAPDRSWRWARFSQTDEFGEVKISEADRRRLKLRRATDTREGNSRRHADKDLVVRSSNSGTNGNERGRSTLKNILDNVNKIDKNSSLHTLNKSAGVGYSNANFKYEDAESSAKSKFLHLLEELGLDERYFPLLHYLSTFGLKESHFVQMYERHMPSLQIKVESAEERLEYLLNVGVKHGDIKKIILRQPQILEYTVENILKPHIAFLNTLGIPESRIGQIITATPSLLSYSVENSLKPTVKYLLEEIGIQEDELSKVVQLSPQILVQRIDVSWNTRLSFLVKELDAPRQSIVKMVTKHPQILHYSIKDGLLPRINFLRSIGMHNPDILKVLTSLTQVFSLSLEGNLKPKYMYLINELRNEVQSLTKYPTYLSLSLDQRIRPRHRFLVSLKKAPKGPFPLSSFVPTDEYFCQQWARTSLDEYLDFRQRLLLKDFAKKYERQ